MQLHSVLFKPRKQKVQYTAPFPFDPAISQPICNWPQLPTILAYLVALHVRKRRVVYLVALHVRKRRVAYLVALHVRKRRRFILLL